MKFKNRWIYTGVALFILMGVLIFFTIFNRTKIPFSEASMIAQNAIPLDSGYRVSQTSGDLKWSFILSKNPVYDIEVITVKYTPFQNKKFEVFIDAKTKEILKIEEME